MHKGPVPGLWSQTRALLIIVSQQNKAGSLAELPLKSLIIIVIGLKLHQCKSQSLTLNSSVWDINRNQIEGGLRESQREMGGKADVLAPELLHGFNLLITNRYNWIQ